MPDWCILVSHSMKTNKGTSLIETLIVIMIIAILAGLLLPAVSKAFLHAKAWIWGVYAFNENRIEAFLGDDERVQMKYATNQPKAWTFVRIDGTNVYILK
jgi:competence protein ComGC